MIPHKVDGTHVFIINQAYTNAFGKSAKTLSTIKIFNFMTKPKTNATAFMQCECEPIFAFVGENEKVIVCGNYKVSNKTFKTFKECENYVKSKPYELMVNTAVLFVKLTEDETKEKTTRQIDEGNKADK